MRGKTNNFMMLSPVDQISKPISCAHATGCFAFFRRLQVGQVAARFEATCAPSLTRGIMWSKCRFLRIDAPHQAHLNFWRSTIRMKSDADTLPFAPHFLARRLLTQAATTSGFLLLYLFVLARRLTLLFAQDLLFCSVTLPELSARQRFNRSRSLFLSKLLWWNTEHSKHIPELVRLSEKCPRSQARPVKYVLSPASRALRLAYWSRFRLIFSSATSSLNLGWLEPSYALPGAATVRYYRPSSSPLQYIKGRT